MISQLIDILTIDNFYAQSKTIDISKGRYELPTTWKSTNLLIKRIWYGRKSNN